MRDIADDHPKMFTSPLNIEICKILHSILVEDPPVIYQIHNQTYWPLELIDVLVENVESLHVVMNGFCVEKIQNIVFELVETKR